MALRNAILAALLDGESSGYDMTKSFDIAVANFWSCTSQQLYRELEKLEAEGLVEARLVEQRRRPNKRLFSLTPEGRAALQQFIVREPKPTAVRDELLVQIEAVDVGDVHAIMAHLDTRGAASTRKLLQYKQSREVLLDGQTEAEYLADTTRIGHFLTLARGIAFEEENIRWCDYVRDILSGRAGPSLDTVPASQ
ncbi:PadR family transcriptional regulator [Rhodococcus sp. BP-349]|uniref:PadR family transcriptional regulator n=1 Tax=unclassified Rhodococcus (in: high G+C Gram-positive bacteria) TaxID=192944 RepID=UPI001C9BB2BE|nr:MULTISPECIES: PadR family transcriptional regulator [unclassified Rhodococcus (in: high G+C Gram-positive bacteria)]MBY6537876.1 PadR family transcriptional regulator [Rhodococcus sp. BP-363]MBY6542213.1 PadR family transcriptional regulator [Rhodococcus sp. BP-369]MBY6561443.1 PadR family transcriptional regulator [Rhodococcus sp. BP-370]MBY6575735.1 PadR family transcriptional regulator [Rhodococcus sp. BP-364]MBY6585036.1 PadR family transcriptional regulator [Rhodococcus sp. BP-358]